VTTTLSLRKIITHIFLSPEEPRLRAGWRLLVQFILLQVIALIIGIPFSVLLYIVPAIDFFLLSLIISVIAVPISIYIARRFIDRRSFVSLGLQWNMQAIKDMWVGFWIAGVTMGVIFLVELATGWLEYQGPGWEGESAIDFLFAFLIWGFIFLAVGFYEELYSRGYRLQNIEEGVNLPIAVLLSSIIFGLEHMSNPNAWWAAWLGITVAGLFLAYAYMRTRQLWLPIGLHIGWNIFEGVVFGFPVSGIQLPGLIKHQVNGPDYFTGGLFGPEAGLVLLPGIFIGVLLVFWYTRHRTPQKENP
jgi:membrane protease YdiL (CAAX protease family)